jgi:catechol 2,3-dioxygenase-like lactoylglutathione lyase family enzyme
MFDHVTLRVPDLSVAAARFETMLPHLGLEPEDRDGQPIDEWEDFSLAQADEDHPPTAQAHVAFVAPTREAVDAFWQAGIDAGLTDNGGPGPREAYEPSYYGAFLLDEHGNNFEAVHRDNMRTGGVIDHVAVRFEDFDSAAHFYKRISAAASLLLVGESATRVAFTGIGQGGLLSINDGPPTEHLHIAFPGDDDAVVAFHEGAVHAGYVSNGEPGERTKYHPGYYAAFVLDPGGNNIEVVNHHGYHGQ